QVDPRVFMESQIAWELAQLPDVDIDPAEVDCFLVGPLGVTRVPAATRAPAPPTAVVSPSMLERLRAKAPQTPPPRPRELVQTTWPGGQRAIETKAR
ncbi:MAG: hypothetical protein KC656_09735, partial [Myxococcales bacterium]|nr:hypothetical protein [Myxococcales bacterium]